MTKTIVNKVKTVLFFFAAIVVTVCFGLAAIGCSQGAETDFNRAIRRARESFGCEKILWCGFAVHGNNVSSTDIEMENGYTYRKDAVLGQRGGYYVIGLNKNGEAQFVLIPKDEGTKVDDSDEIRPSYKSTLFDWPFAYSFSEMAAFMGEHGYKYGNGIEGKIDEYRYGDQTLYPVDRSFDIMAHYDGGDDREEFYNRLDVEFTFAYYTEHEHYLLTQEGGKLKLYEWRFTDSDIIKSVHVYGEQE